MDIKKSNCLTATSAPGPGRKNNDESLCLKACVPLLIHACHGPPYGALATPSRHHPKYTSKPSKLHPKPSKIHPISLPKFLPKRILRGSGRVLGALWQPTMNFTLWDPLLGPKLAPSCGHLGRPGGILAALGRSWAATWPPGTPKKQR